MSTKGHLLTTTDEDEIYEDCVNEWKVNDNFYSELSFSFNRKNIRVDEIDEEFISFTIDKDCELYHKLLKCLSAFSRENV